MVAFTFLEEPNQVKKALDDYLGHAFLLHLSIILEVLSILHLSN